MTGRSTPAASRTDPVAERSAVRPLSIPSRQATASSRPGSYTVSNVDLYRCGAPLATRPTEWPFTTSSTSSASA